MTSLSAILLLVAAPAPPPRTADPRERAEAYYYYSLGHQARLAGSADEALAEYRKARRPIQARRDRAEIARAREAGKRGSPGRAPERCGSPDASTPPCHRPAHQLRGEGDGAEEAAQSGREYEEGCASSPTAAPLNLARSTASSSRRGGRPHWETPKLDPATWPDPLGAATYRWASRPGRAAQKALKLEPSNARATELGDISAPITAGRRSPATARPGDGTRQHRSG